MKTSLSDTILNWRFGNFHSGTEYRLVTQMGAHELVEVVPQPDGTVALKCHDGTEWLSIQRDGSRAGRPTADPGMPGPWEKFTRAGQILTELPKDDLADRDLVAFVMAAPWEDDDGDGGGDPVTAPIRVEGLNFRNADNQIVKIRGLTAFKAPDLWMAGDRDTLERYADFANDLGVNAWRTFWAWGVTGFDPRTHPTFYEEMARLTEWLNGRGFYHHFVLFATRPGDPAHMPEVDQDRHVQQARQCLHGLGAFGEVQNEPYNNGNISARFSKDQFVGLVMARGAALDGWDPRGAGELLDFTTRHPPRNEEFERGFKVLLEDSTLGGGSPDIPSWRATGQPCLAGEPRRIAEGSNARQWGDFFAGCDLHGAGGVVHGGNPTDPNHQSGLQYCQVPTGAALDHCRHIAQLWSEAPIPPEANIGEYSATHLGNAVCEEAGAIKSYAQLFGSKGTLLRVRETEPVRWKNGWREVARTGPDQQVYQIARG